MSYTTDTRDFNIYAEYFDLIGLHEITLKASLAEYPSILTQSLDQSTMIDLIDPCIDPDGIVGTS